MFKKLSGKSNQSSFYVLLVMTIGLVLFGWYNVYSQYVNLKDATVKAIQAAELEIVRATGRAAQAYWVDQLTILNIDANTITTEQIQKIELDFLLKYVRPINLLVPEGNAWIIGRDNTMVFDESDDFPYFGIPIDKFLPMQAGQPNGASDYAQLLSDVLNRHENTGEYIWAQDKGSQYAGLYTGEKGWEIGAWSPAVVDKDHNIKWMIGLTTPLAAIMKESGARDSVNRSILFMSVVTVVIAIVFYSFVLGQRRVQALQKEVAQLKIEIDAAKKQQDVSKIVESEYFQSLKERAAELRARADTNIKKKN